jgi:hypothetical protein
MQNPNDLGIGAQVDKIRAEIRQYGESRVGCDELALLCRNEVSDTRRFMGISEIAEWEHWTFKYLPDGGVRFSGDQAFNEVLIPLRRPSPKAKKSNKIATTPDSPR